MRDEADFEWPVWVAWISAALVIVPLATALVQRRHGYQFFVNGHILYLHPPIAIAASFAALAMVPFVVDAVATIPPCRVPAFRLRFFPIPVLIGVGYLVFHPTSTDFAPFVFVFMAAELASRSEEDKVASVIALVGGIGVMIAAELAHRFSGSYIWVSAIVFGWLGGFLVSSLRAKTSELRVAQNELINKAATDERSRIAREVHDVIAHSMSVTMLHITAARMALKADKPDDALDALEEAERQGRSSMGDIRRTVGLLGAEGDAAAPPMPVAADLPKLVADFQHAGLHVTLDMHGDFGSLPPATGLGIYRIVQESLTNVAKHATGADATVDLSIDDDRIRLCVRNAATNGASASSDGSGIGVRGMVERAAVLDGELVAGPRDGGWVVELIAPR